MMSELPRGFPRFKEPKKAKTNGVKKVSDKTAGRIVERKEVIHATHERAKGKCEAEWIAPHIRCNAVRDADEIVPRGGGGSPYDIENTQSLCRKCHTVKSLEVAACERLGMYGWKRKQKHVPISEEDLEQAKRVFAEAKGRLNI